MIWSLVLHYHSQGVTDWRFLFYSCFLLCHHLSRETIIKLIHSPAEQAKSARLFSVLGPPSADEFKMLHRYSNEVINIVHVMYKLEKYTNLRYMTARLNKKLWKNL